MTYRIVSRNKCWSKRESKYLGGLNITNIENDTSWSN